MPFSSRKSIETAVLELNEVYQESKQNNDSVNSLKHYQCERTIKQYIQRCLYSLDQKACYRLFDRFKQNNVDFDVRDHFQNTTLLFDYASYSGINQREETKFYNTMILLLDYGANPDFCRKLANENDSTCLMQSIRDKDRMALLLDYGANAFFIPGKKQYTIYDYILEVIDKIDNKDSQSLDIDLMSFKKNTQNIKISRDYAKSIIEQQQMKTRIHAKTNPDKPLIQQSKEKTSKTRPQKTNFMIYTKILLTIFINEYYQFIHFKGSVTFR